MKRFAIIGLLTAALLGCASARAQHTLGFVVGYGMSSARFQPTQETRGVWGMYSAGLTWRHYGKQRFVGGFGADLEFLQQGFSFALNASQVEDKKDYRYYTRRVNSVVLPIVWQPHAYLFKHRVRLYLEAAATFSYNISSTYEDEVLRDAGRPTGGATTPSRSSATTAGATAWPAAPASPSSSAASSSTCGPATTSATRTSCATATSMRTTPPTAPRTPSGPRRCARRWTTSTSASA